MLARTYLAALADDLVSDLVRSDFDVRATDAELHFAARDAAQALLARRPSLTDDRSDIEAAIVSTLLDWRDEWQALEDEVSTTVAEMAEADRAA